MYNIRLSNIRLSNIRLSNITLGSWREFGRHDDAWRKSTKEADKHKIFYCNLESKNLSMHWRHHLSNSRQLTSASPILRTIRVKFQ